MLERLGIVLYRLGCIIAGLCVAAVLGLFIIGIGFNGKWPDILIVSGILLPGALIVWVIGRALRYILSGENPAKHRDS